ncbi:MAG TPA: hypothetical protein VH044_09075 [Polyangiaceae bacterium]|jgi:hypothetical protein|nr:hypothetical protein [Polyangiaceae bacterium]
MRRSAAVLGLCAVAWSGIARGADTPLPPDGAGSAPVAAPASVPAPRPVAPTPGADQIQFAAREHDLGYRSYLDKQYDEAASHFENAFFAAPNPVELRSAVRARRDAGELARAATLAAIGLRRFPGDPATGKVAADVIAQARPHVFELQISSPAEYSVAIDDKIVAVERAKVSRLFVNPGAHEVLVSWSDDRNTRIPIEGKEGGTQSLELEPPASSSPPPPVVAPSPPPVPTPPVAVEVQPPPPPKPFGPAVFITGASLTAVGVGLTTWFGIDALNDPGQDAVRRECMGQTAAACAPLQKGLNAQLRTNVALGITGGLAIVTAIVGVFYTEWSGTGASHSPVGPAGGPRVGIGPAGIEGTF